MSLRKNFLPDIALAPFLFRWPTLAFALRCAICLLLHGMHPGCQKECTHKTSENEQLRKDQAKKRGLESVGGRVQATTACQRSEMSCANGKPLQKSAHFPTCSQEDSPVRGVHFVIHGRTAKQRLQRSAHQTAAIRRIKSSCSDWDSAPMVKASRRLSPRAKWRASSWRWRSSPCPRIFMPIMPLPAARISRMTLTTVSGVASMYAPTGLIRTRSTSTQGDLAAARRASMLWHEQP